MKNIFNSASCNRKSFASSKLILTSLLFAFVFTACQKEASKSTEEEIQPTAAKNSQADVLNSYTGLSSQTTWELQQARAATARYRHLENAIKDGYADINVVVPGMGYHYMKAPNVDANFDYKNPEILVYNKDHDGNIELVAVEYAVPLNLSANAPAGFSGNDDVWDRNTGFGLWLLHAWVWNYNPNGVFNPTNPSVHVH